MDDEYNEYGEIKWASCQPDENMTPLDQLQAYQLVNRNFMPFLEAYEAAVLIQILDRTIGWRKWKAIFSAQRLYEGDTVYGGLERTMHRSKMMSALKRLEDRGIVKREVVAGGMVAKAYSINFEIDLDELERSAPSKRKSYKRGSSIYFSEPDCEETNANFSPPEPVANGDNIVSLADPSVSNEDLYRPNEDPREEYLEKRISSKNTIRMARPVPAEPSTLLEENFSKQESIVQVSGSTAVNPPPRKRRARRAPQIDL